MKKKLWNIYYIFVKLQLRIPSKYFFCKREI